MNVHLTTACPARLWPGLLLALATLCASAASPKRVLILNPSTQEAAPFSSVISAFRTTLTRELGEPVDIYEVPLDLARFAEADGEGSFVMFLEGRIRSRPVDLVVPIGGGGVSFAARHRERLFPATPVVVVAADPRTVPPAFLRTNATLVAHQADLSGMVEDILQLQPQTTNIAVVFGASALERFWVNECRREFQGFTNRVGFTWLNELPLPQVLDRCAHLPPQSFILHVFFLVDVAGVPYEKNEALRGLHEGANAPLFGFFASELGLGPIGGRLYQEAEVGSQGARTAIRILRGERPESIAPQVLDSGTPVFDGRELQRWGISESRLPPDSVVKFREPTLWEQHRWRIIAITSTCVVEGVLIILLLSNLLRRRRAERALRESEERLSVAVAAGDVGVWVWNLDDNGVWASKHWRQMLGFQPGEAVHYESVLERIHPEDRATVDATVQRAVKEQAEYKGEYRVVLPDGTQRWIAARGRLDSNGNGRRVRMLGASVDVTGRKQVEESARDLSGRLLRAQEEERARLGRELHDDITQRLARLAMDVGQCERGTPESSPAETLREVREGLVRLSEDVHALAYRLHPSLVDDLGLADALKAECERFARQEPTAVEVKVQDVPATLPQDTALGLFRVAQEALRNVSRHARASTVQVTLRPMQGGLQLAIQDNGTGFDPVPRSERRSLGLASMRERVRLLGGELDIESAPGHGTTVVAWVPLTKAEG